MQAVRLARYHTRPPLPGALLRRLPRLVGRRAAGRRQSERGARHLHAQGHGRGDAAGAAIAPRHRLRAGEPAAGAASEQRRAGGFDAARQRDAARNSIARPTPPGCSGCARCARERGIVLIFDEVFVGFRLAPGGAQEYFGVRADLVTYGKTVAAACRSAWSAAARQLMRRFRDDRPADVCFARGTFNSHPYVMGAMHEFLRAAGERPGSLQRYRDLDGIWDAARGRAQCAPAWPQASTSRWPISRRSGPSATRGRRATTGCSSTTCARTGWR